MQPLEHTQSLKDGFRGTLWCCLNSGSFVSVWTMEWHSCMSSFLIWIWCSDSLDNCLRSVNQCHQFCLSALRNSSEPKSDFITIFPTSGKHKPASYDLIWKLLLPPPIIRQTKYQDHQQLATNLEEPRTKLPDHFLQTWMFSQFAKDNVLAFCPILD